jgi:hypothetical protein
VRTPLVSSAIATTAQARPSSVVATAIPLPTTCTPAKGSKASGTAATMAPPSAVTMSAVGRRPATTAGSATALTLTPTMNATEVRCSATAYLGAPPPKLVAGTSSSPASSIATDSRALAAAPTRRQRSRRITAVARNATMAASAAPMDAAATDRPGATLNRPTPTSGSTTTPATMPTTSLVVVWLASLAMIPRRSTPRYAPAAEPVISMTGLSALTAARRAGRRDGDGRPS